MNYMYSFILFSAIIFPVLGMEKDGPCVLEIDNLAIRVGNNFYKLLLAQDPNETVAVTDPHFKRMMLQREFKIKDPVEAELKSFLCNYPNIRARFGPQVTVGDYRLICTTEQLTSLRLEGACKEIMHRITQFWDQTVSKTVPPSNLTRADSYHFSRYVSLKFPEEEQRLLELMLSCAQVADKTTVYLDPKSCELYLSVNKDQRAEVANAIGAYLLLPLDDPDDEESYVDRGC